VEYVIADCLEWLPTLPDNSVDSIVTDPPYGLKFMNHAWDYNVPTQEIWEECLRVLKPGGFLLSFFGTRTYHRGVTRIEDAGFEICDQLGWLYANGFLKSKTRLKPAWEPICMARKQPTGSISTCFNRHGTGYINLDECRVLSEDGTPTRYPSNVIHDGSDEALSIFPEYVKSGGGRRGETGKRTYLGKSESNSLAGKRSGGTIDSKIYFDEDRQDYYTLTKVYDDCGSASRYFYCAKASPSEREKDNHHPTVKPLKLIEHLVKLVTPVNGIVLDPFLGSGTTLKACLETGRNGIGCEKNQEYEHIIKKRIGQAVVTLDRFDGVKA